MKILVFEYLTGGGYNRQPFPAGLAGEGLFMLQALLDDFADLDDVELTVMLDRRMTGLIDLHGFKPVVISGDDDCLYVFESLLPEFDAVWPLAPETGGLLLSLCLAVERQGKILLTSPASAVAVTGNKFQTHRQLCEHGIDTVPTVLLTQVQERPFSNPFIVKALDGAGCEDSMIIDGESDALDFPGCFPKQGDFIVQPLLPGLTTSLSCLFHRGQGWPICANLQTFTRSGRRFRLAEIGVNHQAVQTRHQELVIGIARAFPELWGYAGIDLIELPDSILVLEINPRLTTSYAGIKEALGINVASSVLSLLSGSPINAATINKEITITMNQINDEAV